MKLEDFISIYVASMEYLSSPKTKKINAIVCLKLLNELPVDIALNHFESFMKDTVPEIIAFLNKKENGTQPAKKNPYIFSFRKQLIRMKQMYDDFDLYGFFKESVKNFEQNVKGAGMNINSFSRKELEANFIKLLNN